jgi:nitroimidazol reductase NimA-like FMN-containing flavoprotein (pyridoxamine 5'-phosphate oxidase superfamily)
VGALAHRTAPSGTARDPKAALTEGASPGYLRQLMTTLQTDRTTVRRLGKRGNYDAETIKSIIDEALICHVGFVVDGAPVVIPTIHTRVGDTLYLHGSAASRMLRSLKQGVEACVTITLLDGLVLARSAFHHSMNYRSVVVFGTAREVDGEEKLRALGALVEHVCRGRSADARPPNDVELRQTLVLALPIAEASAKIRTGPPIDDEEDYALDVWAGVIPMRVMPQPAVADERLASGIAVPNYVMNYSR